MCNWVVQTRAVFDKEDLSLTRYDTVATIPAHADEQYLGLIWCPRKYLRMLD